MELQTKVQLPSNGKLYPLKEVTIKPMSSEDFDIVNDASDPEFIFKVVQNSIVEPQGFDIMTLHPFDIDAILFALRSLSIGPTYNQTAICPYCKKQQDVVIDIDSFETKYLEKAFKSPIKLPNGDLVNITHITEQIQKDAREIIGMNQSRLPLQILIERVKSIKFKEPKQPHPNVTVDEITSDIEIEEYIKSLSYIDRLYLQQAAQNVNFGVDTTIKCKCENEQCGKEFRVMGAVDGVSAPEFFRPTLFKE